MRLFRRQNEAEADVRPTLLGVVTLLFLLLFFLLSTSSGQRLGVVDLRLAAAGEAPPLPHAGLVKSVQVSITTDGARIEFEVASTDIAAAATARELRAIDIARARDGASGPDIAALSAALERVHAIDGSQERAEVRPAPNLSTDVLLSVLDAVRGAPAAPLFPKLSLL